MHFNKRCLPRADSAPRNPRRRSSRFRAITICIVARGIRYPDDCCRLLTSRTRHINGIIHSIVVFDLSKRTRSKINPSMLPPVARNFEEFSRLCIEVASYGDIQTIFYADSR